MASFTDATGTLWSVERKWRPFPDVFDIEDDIFGWLGLLLALPALIFWPFWLLAKFLGVAWKIDIERDGRRVGREKVRGWHASSRRIDAITQEIRASQARHPF